MIRGQLSLSSDGRPLRSDEAVDAVVYFRPAVPVPVVVPLAPLIITTERKTFVPRVLPVPVGASCSAQGMVVEGGGQWFSPEQIAMLPSLLLQPRPDSPAASTTRAAR